jgi:hypothetical protein
VTFTQDAPQGLSFRAERGIAAGPCRQPAHRRSVAAAPAEIPLRCLGQG